MHPAALPRPEAEYTAPRRSPGARGGWLAGLWLGLLTALSLPTTEWWPLALVAWVPIFGWLPREPSPRRRLLVGWLAGFTLELIIFRWIPFTITEMTPLPLAAGGLMALAYALWHGLVLGLGAMLAPPLARQAARLHAGLAPVATVLVFVVLGWLWPVVFAWSPAHALWEVAPVHHVAATFGVPGLFAALLLPQAALAELLRSRAGAEPSPRLRASVCTPLALAAVLFAVGLLTWRLAATSEVVETLRVGVLQPNYTLAEKKHADRAMRERLFARFSEQLAAIPPGRFDLLIASEGAFPLYWRTDTPPLGTPATGTQEATRRLQEVLARGPRTPAMIGGLREVGEVTDASGRRRRELANSVVFFDAEARIVGAYDKRLLVPFSEAVPFSDIFPALRDAVPGFGTLRRGASDCRFPLPDSGLVVSCGICYENLFAPETRAGLGDARLIANFTIDTWFGTSTAPRLHLASHASRAVELGVPFVRSALTGISAVVAADGAVLGRLPLDVRGVLAVEVPITAWVTPYRHVGDLFAQLATLFVVALAFLAWRARRRELSVAGGVEAAHDVQRDRDGAPADRPADGLEGGLSRRAPPGDAT
jgi:apolipoprotein N-acyltransferase